MGAIFMCLLVMVIACVGVNYFIIQYRKESHDLD
jgi:hypothetical protein